MKKLTPTSYALLSLLTLRPWSAYELTGYMQRSILQAVWPRATSKLYDEPKNLVAHGLARAASRKRAGRVRTVYTITAQGRKALRAWLDEPGAGPLLEFEALLKVVQAHCGNREQLLTQLERIHTGVDRARVELVATLGRWLEFDPILPERFHLNVLATKFLVEFGRAISEWSGWAREVVTDWPDTQIDDTKRKQSLKLVRQLLAELRVSDSNHP